MRTTRRATALLLAALAILPQAACATDGAEASAGPAGKWLAEDIGGRGVIDDAQTILELAPDGTVSGSGGCNRMAGKARIQESKITFGPLAGTMMACPDALMDQESRFHEALKSVRRWQIDPATRKLTLEDDAGTAMVVFTPL